MPAAAAVGLLVVLHGDDTTGKVAAADWQRAADAAHLVVFAPECPHALGCDGSWWRWALMDTHDPGWLAGEVAKAAAAHHVDRVYITGYSGGASYLASWAPAHADAFPDVAYISGGYVATETCPAAALHALIVIGDEDDDQGKYTAPFARWLTACKTATVTSRTVRHVGHREMHAALRAHVAREVIAWLTPSP